MLRHIWNRKPIGKGCFWSVGFLKFWKKPIFHFGRIFGVWKTYFPMSDPFSFWGASWSIRKNNSQKVTREKILFSLSNSRFCVCQPSDIPAQKKFWHVFWHLFEFDHQTSSLFWVSRKLDHRADFQGGFKKFVANWLTMPKPCHQCPTPHLLLEWTTPEPPDFTILGLVQVLILVVMFLALGRFPWPIEDCRKTGSQCRSTATSSAYWALAAAIVHCVPVCDRFSKLAMKIGPKPGTWPPVYQNLDQSRNIRWCCGSL